MAGSETTGKLFTKIVRGLPSGFNLIEHIAGFRLADILRVPQAIKGFGELDF